MRRCQLSNAGIRRVCLGQDATRPITCRRDFHAARSQREDDSQSTTESAPRTKRASSAAAARDLLNLPRPTEYQRYFRKDFGPPTPNDASASAQSSAPPRQVVFRGARPAGASGGPGRGGMERFTPGGARGGATAGRGGATGRGGAARGGRGGSSSGPQRRTRAPAQKSEDGENDGEFEEDPMEVAPEYLLEDHPVFENEPEAESYIALMELVEGAEARYTKASELAAKGSETNDKEMSREAERATQRVDEDIRAGLAQLQATQDMVRPRHAPQDIAASHFARDIGSLPVGSGGMGHVVEEGLRLLAKRVGHEWEHPRALAERLMAGEFIKFRNMPEKRDVIRVAGELGLEGSQGEKVRFMPLDENARKALVERLVRGQSGYATDSALNGNVLKNIARLTNGNPTIPGDAKAMLLKTVQSLLPAERASQGSRPTRSA